MNDDDDDVFGTTADRHGRPTNPAEQTRADGLRCRSAPCPENVSRRETGMTDEPGDTGPRGRRQRIPQNPHPPRRAHGHGTLQTPQADESVIVGYYTSAEVHPLRNYRTRNRKED